MNAVALVLLLFSSFAGEVVAAPRSGDQSRPSAAARSNDQARPSAAARSNDQARPSAAARSNDQARPSAAPRLKDLELRTSHEWASEPLTTERARMLDSDALNPHRQRWILSRQTQLRGLEVRKIPSSSGSEFFGVKASLIETVSRSFVRPAGPWYRPLTEFPCMQEPQSWFANEAGTREAAEVAARHWDEILNQEKPKLSWMLSHVTARSAPVALVKGRDAFEIWLKNSEAEWRYTGGVKARIAEWRSYLQSAASAGICKGSSRRPPVTPISWTDMMEPVPSEGHGGPSPKVLIRAPARRWNGLFSVRLNVLIGVKRLSGQFLVDSGAGKSIISPVWLESQGVLPALVQSPDTRLQRVTWSGGSGLAKQVVVDGVDMSGFELSIRDFLLFETDFFQPPQNQAACCDGILGSDFLRKNVVEFLPGTPPALRIWSPDGYRLPAGQWAEVAMTSAGEVVSACTLEPQKPSKASSVASAISSVEYIGESPPEPPVEESRKLLGVRWDTGSEVPLDIHAPWQATAKREGLYWKLFCGSQKLAEQIPVTFPHRLPGTDETLFSSRYPAMNAGIALLDRAPFVFDLPHGRLWYSKDSVDAPFYHDGSGLVLEYRMIEGERTLVVKSIKPGSPAQALASSGLRAGQHLSEMDSRPAEEMDFWEVEQRLSGAYGSTVQVKWKFRDGVKSASMKVR